MNAEDLKAAIPELERFHQRFARFFCRTEGRAASQRYLTGLMLPIERKNVENVAEQVGVPIRRLQEFLSDSPWDDEGCIDELQRFVGEHLGTKSGVLILDDTGFAKKGTHSAGVGRQYSGTLGRRDNCQVGVFLAYASSKGHTLVDRRLYLLKEWFTEEAAARWRRAAIPEGLEFRTKLDLGAEMVREAYQAGHLPFQWVTGDAAYGDSHDLRSLVTELERWYCFEVSSNTDVWAADPAWEVPPRRGTHAGRLTTRKRPTTASPRSMTVAELTVTLNPQAWVRHRVTEGAKGPREYEFARVRVIEKRHRQPGPEGWLMLRRPVGGGEVKYYLSNAPASMALEEMAWTGCLRWTIEENFELAKGETGLDHYEVTKLRGWYHHITLSLLALAFMKAVQRSWGKKIRVYQRPGGAPAARGGTASSAVGPGDRPRLAARPTPAQGGSLRIPSSPLAA
jgi:SRSO17 transposase